MPAKNNKRGDRGSIEEDVNAAKRSNMADAHGDETTSEPGEEPSLSEIKEMLTDIKATVTLILCENTQLKEELAELTAASQLKDKELRDLKAKLHQTTTSNTRLKTELDSTITLLHSTKKNLEDQAIEVDRLGESLDNLEQHTCKNSLEFHGVSEGAYETTEEAVLKIAEALNVEVATSDIEISHKLKRKNSNNIIIAKFCSHKIKTKLYKERIKLKNFKATDLFPGYATTAGTKGRLLINENLTPYRRSLVDSANGKRRDGNVCGQ